VEDGEEVTLLHWGNVKIGKVAKDKAGNVIAMTGTRKPDGNVKDTKKKLHWVPKLDDQVTPVVLREFDHLVTKPKFEDDDEVKDYINPASVVDTLAIGDPSLKTLKRGDKLQLERRGYFIVDQIAYPSGKSMVLFKIPDGKAKDMGIASKVDPSKLQGSVGAKGEKKSGASDLEAQRAAKKAEKEAQKAKSKAKK
jgi:glutamyl-tRNA synthetase